PADRISVYLLDPVGELGGMGTFPLYPYGSQARTGIHAEKSLEGESMAQLLALWSDLLRDDEGSQAACHYPIHGLRCFCDDSFLYETRVCWWCTNYYGKSETGYTWFGLPGHLPQGSPAASCVAVRRLLEYLLPIPESLVQKATERQAQFRPHVGYGGRRHG